MLAIFVRLPCRSGLNGEALSVSTCCICNNPKRSLHYYKMRVPYWMKWTKLLWSRWHFKMVSSCGKMAIRSNRHKLVGWMNATRLSMLSVFRVRAVRMVATRMLLELSNLVVNLARQWVAILSWPIISQQRFVMTNWLRLCRKFSKNNYQFMSRVQI